MIVDDTIDLGTVAARLITFRCLCAGQVCVAPEYVLCPKKIQDKLVRALENEIKQHWGGKSPME